MPCDHKSSFAQKVMSLPEDIGTFGEKYEAMRSWYAECAPKYDECVAKYDRIATWHNEVEVAKRQADRHYAQMEAWYTECAPKYDDCVVKYDQIATWHGETLDASVQATDAAAFVQAMASIAVISTSVNADGELIMHYNDLTNIASIDAQSGDLIVTYN